MNQSNDVLFRFFSDSKILKGSFKTLTLDIGLFFLGVAAVILLSLSMIFCLGRSEKKTKILIPKIWIPELSQFPLAIQNQNFNETIEMPILLHPAITSRNSSLSTVASAEFFTDIIDELVDFTSREMERHDQVLQMIDSFLSENTEI